MAAQNPGSGGGESTIGTGAILGPNGTRFIGADDYLRYFIAQGKASSSWNFAADFPKMGGHLYKMAIWPVSGNEPDADFTLTLTTQNGIQWSTLVDKDGESSILLPCDFYNGGEDNLSATATIEELNIAISDLENSNAAGQVHVEIWMSTKLGARQSCNQKTYTLLGESTNTTEVDMFIAPLQNHRKHNLRGTIKNNHSSAVTATIILNSSTNREIWQDSIAADYTLDLKDILRGIELVETTDKVEFKLTSSPGTECDFVAVWDESPN